MSRIDKHLGKYLGPLLDVSLKFHNDPKRIRAETLTQVVTNVRHEEGSSKQGLQRCSGIIDQSGHEGDSGQRKQQEKNDTRKLTQVAHLENFG